MPYVSGLSDPILIKKFHRGMTDKQIAEEYGISVAAVSARRVRLGLRRKPVSQQVNDYLAHRWTVVTSQEGYSHHNRWPIQQLRAWLRYRLGDDKLSTRQVEAATKWAAERVARDEVLCYDPHSEAGWYYRPRTPADGRLIIDWPTELAFPDDKFKRALELPLPAAR